MWTISQLQPPSFILRAGLDLSIAEAASLAASGKITRILHGVYSTASPTPLIRAWAAGLHLRPACRAGLIIHRMSAAWIFGCGPAPRWIECSTTRRSSLRLSVTEEKFCLRRFTGYTRYEDLRLGPIRVTTPLRTCLDLAMWDEGIRADNALRTMMLVPDLGCYPETLDTALVALPRVARRGQIRARIRDLHERAVPPSGAGRVEAGQLVGAGRDPVMR